MPEPVRIVAAVIDDGAGRVLLVRKRGSHTFIQPGGKPEPGERPLDTLRRELAEELGVRLLEAGAVRLGAFEADAVNEPGRRVQAEAWAVRIDGVPRPGAEIEAMAWWPADPPADAPIAPLSRHHLLPAWRAAVGGGSPRTP